MPNSSWWWDSWRDFLPAPWLQIILTLVAAACGLIVGGERQRREKPAGLRTLAMVCLGSAVFTMASYAFATTTNDTGRVAAQIVTGIGFLGAGVVFHGRRTISGLTTAATIWVTAAIGMTVGAGFVVGGLALSLLVDRLLAVIFLYETRWHPDLRESSVVLEYASKSGLARVRLERVLVEYNLVGIFADWSQPTPETGRLTLHARMPRVHLCELLAELAEVSDVLSIQQTAGPKITP